MFDQSIATSHDLGPQNVAEEGGKSGLVKDYYFVKICFINPQLVDLHGWFKMIFPGVNMTI